MSECLLESSHMRAGVQTEEWLVIWKGRISTKHYIWWTGCSGLMPDCARYKMIFLVSVIVLQKMLAKWFENFQITPKPAVHYSVTSQPSIQTNQQESFADFNFTIYKSSTFSRIREKPKNKFLKDPEGRLLPEVNVGEAEGPKTSLFSSYKWSVVCTQHS